MHTTTNKLTKLQQELLKIFAVNVDEKELLDIKDMLSEYFASKALDRADKIWDERGYTDETVKQLLNREDQ
jgi:hypothetical protein